MSRFDYTEYNPQIANLWQANMRRALAGKQGRRRLAELEAALLSLPEKVLIDGALYREGYVCALGALALYQRLKSNDDVEWVHSGLENDSRDFSTEWDVIEYASQTMGMTEALAYAIAWANDEGDGAWQPDETPSQRYDRVLAWVRRKIAEAAA
jgi:hypothetical protein